MLCLQVMHDYVPCSIKIALFHPEMISAQFFQEMCFLQESYKKIWIFWVRPPYRIWEYAFNILKK